MATWFLAASPMRRSESVKATYDGVVRLPLFLELDYMITPFKSLPDHWR